LGQILYQIVSPTRDERGARLEFKGGMVERKFKREMVNGGKRCPIVVIKEIQSSS